MALCGAVAGCGTGQRESDAAAAADEFLTAIGEGDGAAACAVLAPEAQEDLAASEGQPCEEAVGAQQLSSEAVDDVDVWGDRAQVRAGADVLFLVELDDGWKVAAAGCSPQGDRPYECEVSGS
ncbi:hypothetical protein [Glycomyces albidus]|jgi:hypothetical protein|uniref:DUF4878 domain-containing protein n=1 Tax=Glycomyces albidus TaxID=2656774 RepID=A0A6L5GGA5_9ACTN|nr:hypothetical protein [Glycomyces albidus]MQM28754.1 hypothetical protein [Glycomyces albidus]